MNINNRIRSTKKGAISTVAALALLLSTVTASHATAIVACGATNVGCESGASSGLGACSFLGNLYRRTHAAGWGCTSGGAVTNYTCDEDFDTDNCCGRPNAQTCPQGKCPCPVQQD